MMNETKKYKLPVSLESCISHYKLMRFGKEITHQERVAIEETHNFIEMQMQMRGKL
jgi:hypothetical protein